MDYTVGCLRTSPHCIATHKVQCGQGVKTNPPTPGPEHLSVHAEDLDDGEEIVASAGRLALPPGMIGLRNLGAHPPCAQVALPCLRHQQCSALAETTPAKGTDCHVCSCLEVSYGAGFGGT